MSAAFDGCVAYFWGPRMATLTIYRICGNIHGIPVTGCEDLIVDPDNLTTYDLTGNHDFEARLKAHKREDGTFAGADNAVATYHSCIPA